jgi:hypothetical protein
MNNIIDKLTMIATTTTTTTASTTTTIRRQRKTKQKLELSSVVMFFTIISFAIIVGDAFIVNSKRKRTVGTSTASALSAIIRRDFRHVWEEANNPNDTENLDRSTKKATKRLRTTLQTPIKTFTSIIECFDTIDNALPNQLTVVLYFAHYCKMCHQANIPYKKLAYSYEEETSLLYDDDESDKDPKIQFTRIETSVLTKPQFQSLGISRVPFVQIYRNQICIASFSTNFRILEEQLKDTLVISKHRSILEWVSFFNQHDKEIQSNKLARQTIRNEILFNNNRMDDEPSSNNLVRTVASEKQLLDAIDSSKKSTVSVIMYHSHFEQACVRAQHQ